MSHSHSDSEQTGLIYDHEDHGLVSPLVYPDAKDETSYGFGSFHPRSLQFLNTTKWLLFFFCVAVATSTMAGSSLPPILGTLEQEYNLNSVQTGILIAIYDLTSTLVVIFICHYGERGHKGHWIAVGVVVYSIGSFLMPLPHFLRSSQPPSNLHNQSLLCTDSEIDEGSVVCQGKGEPQFWAYAIFLLANGIRGIGATPLGPLMVSYLDENVAADKSPIYIATQGAVAVIAMAAGYVISGQFLGLYGDIDKVPPSNFPDRSSPEWFGCWWPPFFITGALAFVFAIPIFGYPKELPAKRELNRESELDEQAHHSEDGRSPAGNGFAIAWSEMPAVTLSLLKNPVFVFFILRTIVEVIFGSGWATFMPKFLVNMYGFDAGTASMMCGLIVVLPVVVGTMVGGWIIGKMKLRVRGVLLFGFVTTTLGAFCCLGILFSCPTRSYVGANVDYHGKKGVYESVDDACNKGCGCDPSDFRPVCLPQGQLTFYSPCYAGCTSFQDNNQTDEKFYENCKCVEKYFPAEKSELTEGRCEFEDCATNRYVFLGFWSFICFFYGMSGIPLLQGLLRAIPFHQRTFAMGLQLIPIRLFGTIPGPILMGYLFDQSCVLWKKSCGDSLNCLYYDNQTLVHSSIITGSIIKILSGIFLLLPLLLYRPPPSAENELDTTSKSWGSLLWTKLRGICSKTTAM